MKKVRERSRSRDAGDRDRGARGSGEPAAAAEPSASLHEPVLPLKEDHDANGDDESDSDATQEYEFASWQYMKEQAALPAVDIECAQTDFFFSAPDADRVVEAIEEGPMNSRPDCVEIGMGAPLMYWVCPEAEHVRRPGTGE
eukprot:3887243-Pyramimonas_sp.AAC.1